MQANYNEYNFFCDFFCGCTDAAFYYLNSINSIMIIVVPYSLNVYDSLVIIILLNTK